MWVKKMFLVMHRITGKFVSFTDHILGNVAWVKFRDSAFKCDNPTLAFNIAETHNGIVIME